MTPAHLKAFSLYSDLEALFERAKDERNYTIRALPEEEVANFLVDELSLVLVRAEALIEGLASRQRSYGIPPEEISGIQVGRA